MKNRIAIFATGSGSNAQALIEYFQKNESASVELILSNKSDSFALQRAQKMGVNGVFFNNQTFKTGEEIIDVLSKHDINWVLLAGFLLKIPLSIVRSYKGKIINIHPSLLPKFGGKGMYGEHVHQAVIDSGERESGISIHHVSEEYDEGNIIFQARCQVLKEDTAKDLAKKIQVLEHQNYPIVIEKLIKNDI
jgi:phosphoribosylglycinamide formyltransferase 1